MGQEIPDVRQVFYVNELYTYSDTTLDYVFDRALLECKFFPQISELIQFAEEFRTAEAEKKRLAREEEKTREIFSRPDKPPNWSADMDSIWAEVDRKRAAQEIMDLADTRELIPNAHGEYWNDDLRIFEARERRRKGLPMPSAREEYEKRLWSIFNADQKSRQAGGL